LGSEPSIRSSNIWGKMILSFFGPKKVNFKENIGGALKAPPHQETYIFNPTWNRVKSLDKKA